MTKNKGHTLTDKPKNLGGRPKIHDADITADKLLAYINNSEDPMIEEYCLDNDISKDTIYRLAKENARLSDVIKKCHLRQEILTVRAIQNGVLNPTFGIFKLKQPRFGWTDKIETENINLNHDMTEDEADAILKRFK